MPTSPYGDLTAPSRPLDKDRLSMVPRELAVMAAHRSLAETREEHPEVTMAGVALLFAVLATRCRMDPQTLHQMGMRLLRDVPGHRKDNMALQSLQDYAGIRIMGEHNVSIS